jgi:hypothetical protein
MKVNLFKFLFALSGLFLVACQSAALQTKVETIQPTPKPSKSVQETQIKTGYNQVEGIPKVKWLYIAEPLKFISASNYGSTKIAVFYENGEWCKMWAGTLLIDQEESVFGFFDEVVEYGKWKEEGGRIKITVQKCRCLHCDEDHGELTREDSKNPLPLEEVWEIEKGKSGEVGSVLKNSKTNFRFLPANEFVLKNYDEMISEPIKVKNADSEGRCMQYDLKDF